MRNIYISGLYEKYGQLSICGKSKDNSGLPDYDLGVATTMTYGIDCFLKNELILKQLDIKKGLRNKTYVIMVSTCL